MVGNVRRWFAAVISAALFVTPVILDAQDNITGNPDSLPGRLVTAVEVERKLSAYTWGILAPINSDGQYVAREARADSLKARIARATKSFDGKTLHGFDQEALAWLNLSLLKFDVAQGHVNTILGNPGLSTSERAFILQSAVSNFAGMGNAQSINVARNYLSQLKALPTSSAAADLYQAQIALGEAHFDAGRSKEAIVEYEQAVTTLKDVPFIHRNLVYSNEAVIHYAVAMSGQQNGRPRIEAMTRKLLSLMRPSPELIARDSGYIRIGNIYSNDLGYKLEQAKYLGTAAPAIIATHWINTSVPQRPSAELSNARYLPTTDGKIRLLEFGDFTCGACMAALPLVDSLRLKVPQSVEVWFVTHTTGSWGIKSCEPDEEVAHLKDFYTEQKKLGLPIAIWAGPREATSDDGSVPRESPNTKAYSVTTTPTFVLIDGQGKVRHLEVGLTREGYDRMVQRIDFLVRESGK